MIAGVSYQAYENMTWGEWVNSSFNTAKLIVDGQSIRNSFGENVATPDYMIVSPGDAIINNFRYIFATSGGGLG